jgi:outer membrane lipoprotein carrier protein
MVTLGVVAAIALLAPWGATAVGAQAAASADSRGQAAAAPSPAAVLARARAEFATVRSARAEFTQEIKNPLTGRTMQSRGTLLQRKPGHIAVTFTEPAGDRIVSDGSTLWVYLPSTAPGQVLRMPAGAGGTGGVDLAATVLDASREGYDLADAGVRTMDGRATRGVTLTAQSGTEVPFPRATLWIDDADATVREVAIIDPAGVNRVIRIVTWQKNVAVPDSAFRFVVPRGVRVVAQP